jgi:hypothetical protein
VTSFLSLSKVIAEITVEFGSPVSPSFMDSLNGENTGENTAISNAPITVEIVTTITLSLFNIIYKI